MPARVIRGEINASDSLARVSMPADLTFRALIVAADDWGRLDGRLPVLRGMLFPLRQEVTDRKLDGWLDELAAGSDAPIVRYVVDGRPFIALMGWEKHRGKAKRAASSKYPEPHPRRSADIPGIREISGDPPESRSRNRETRDERREGEGELEGATASLAPASPTPSAPVRKSSKIPKPASFTGETRDRIQTWAASKGYDRAVLNAALERFREWEPLKTQNRTMSQWVGAFMRIVREGVDEGKIQRAPAGPASSRYRDAESVLAEARRKQREDDERARGQAGEAEQVAKVIELSLRQAAGGGA